MVNGKTLGNRLMVHIYSAFFSFPAFLYNFMLNLANGKRFLRRERVSSVDSRQMEHSANSEFVFCCTCCIPTTSRLP